MRLVAPIFRRMALTWTLMVASVMSNLRAMILLGSPSRQAFQDFRLPCRELAGRQIRAASALPCCPEAAALASGRVAIDDRAQNLKGQNTLAEHDQFQRLDQNLRGTGF